jgi:hypothetical protein
MTRAIWWCFDRTPKRFQDWAEAWARTLIARRSTQYQQAINWARNQP